MRVVIAVGMAGFAVAGVTAVVKRWREPVGNEVQRGLARVDLENVGVEVVASDLEVPWAIAFLPDGSLLVTERPGRLRHVGTNGGVASIPVRGVRQSGESGLLGVAVHPEFASNGFIYLYSTTAVGGGKLTNRVDRYRLDAASLSERATIIEGIPGAPYHDGGFMAFGPDGKIYVTTGDASDERTAQDLHSLAGKILRLNDDGTVPDDNPFGSAIWSYGHRNPQGLAWDGQGRLWATEHGRSGIVSGYDELNLIQKGKNYGWPTIQGAERAAGMETPVAQSGADTTWAPSGAAHVSGKIFFGGLRGEALYEAGIGAVPVSITAHFENAFGRIRAVVAGPDGRLYFTTSNRDGRGKPSRDDDRILRVHPSFFE